jgi:hypothetical protein
LGGNFYHFYAKIYAIFNAKIILRKNSFVIFVDTQSLF